MPILAPVRTAAAIIDAVTTASTAAAAVVDDDDVDDDKEAGTCALRCLRILRSLVRVSGVIIVFVS